MTAPTPTPRPYTPAVSNSSQALKAILWGGLACGVLDLTFALIFYPTFRGGKPMGVMQSIAAGLLGKGAFQGGAGTVALGVLLHFVISFGAATGFFLASRKLRFLTGHAIVGGMLYGVVFYFFMNGVVLPLSALPNAPFPPRISARILPVLGAHLFFVGLPIALAVRRWAKPAP
ncbi:MAG TPA: hypothetical protein VHO24_01775 [Opitutaceae bacterium]|nr:hypothetical protein [Opitutaceae bacterium]